MSAKASSQVFFLRADPLTVSGRRFPPQHGRQSCGLFRFAKSPLLPRTKTPNNPKPLLCATTTRPKPAHSATTRPEPPRSVPLRSATFRLATFRLATTRPMSTRPATTRPVVWPPCRRTQQKGPPPCGSGPWNSLVRPWRPGPGRYWAAARSSFFMPMAT